MLTRYAQLFVQYEKNLDYFMGISWMKNLVVIDFCVVGKHTYTTTHMFRNVININ